MTPFTTAQITVITALATGATVTAAAQLASVSRPTVYKWLEQPSFQQAVDFARQEHALTIRDRLLALSTKALDKLEAVLDDPRSSPSVLTKVALAILNRKEWHLPTGAPESEPTIEDLAKTAAQTDPELTKLYTNSNFQPVHAPLQNEPNAQIPRGAPCPCGSGLKYKRCCGQNAPPLLHTKVAA